MSRDINSIGIKKQFGPNMELDVLDTIGSGDSKLTLYRASTGVEVIETNGDPLWEGEEGFAETRDRFVNADDCNL